METERSAKRERLLKSLVKSESRDKRERIAKTLIEMERRADSINAVSNGLWESEMLVNLARRIEKRLARRSLAPGEEIRLRVRRRDSRREERDFFKPIRAAYRKQGFMVVLEETEKEEVVRNTWSLYNRRKKGTVFVLEKTTAELQGRRKFLTLVVREL